MKDFVEVLCWQGWPRAAAVALAVGASPVLAQTAPPVVDLQRAISALQGQRNSAQDAHAQCEVGRMGMSEEIAALKAKVAELEKPK